MTMSEKIWIAPNQQNLIGFRVKVFFKEMSQYLNVDMSVAQALTYLRTNAAELFAIYHSDGEIFSAFATRHRNNHNEIAISTGTYFKDYICGTESFPAVSDRNYSNVNWYLAIGDTAYPILPEGGIDCNDPGSFGSFAGRQAKLLNLAGHDVIKRPAMELAGPAYDARYSKY